MESRRLIKYEVRRMKDENTSPSHGLEGNFNFQQTNATKSDWVGDSDCNEVFHTSYLILQPSDQPVSSSKARLHSSSAFLLQKLFIVAYQVNYF